jgi:hypothetical protein
MVEHPAAVVAALNLIFTVAMAVGGVWLKLALAQMNSELHKAITEARHEIDERVDMQRREFGETVGAIRAKIIEIELYIRDTYVRQDAFTRAFDDLAARIELRIDRLESKIHGGPP